MIRDIFEEIHERLAVALDVQRPQLREILHSPLVSSAADVRSWPGLNDGGLYQSEKITIGIYPGYLRKKIKPCEDAVYSAELLTLGIDSDVVVITDGVSAGACSLSLARLLAFHIGENIKQQLLQGAFQTNNVGKNIDAALHTIAPYFHHSVYPYGLLLEKMDKKHNQELKRILKEGFPVAGSTVNVLVRQGNDLVVFLIGDGRFELYAPDGQVKECLVTRIRERCPEQVNVYGSGACTSLQEIRHIHQGSYTLLPEDTWSLSSDGIDRVGKRVELQRILTGKIAGNAAVLLDDLCRKSDRCDDIALVTNADLIPPIAEIN